MRHHGDRKITVNKDELIETIKENKENHVVAYQKAVKAYKIEAKRRLSEQLKDLKSGSLKIHVSLVAPENKTEDYDKLIKMFEWEVNDVVELSLAEFNEYVHDETDFSMAAKFANSTYLVSAGVK